MVLAEESYAAYAGGAAALLVAGVGWLFRLLSVALAKKIDEAKAELTASVNVQIEQSVKQFGETVAAVRQKMNDMELWNRDNFVTKRTFDAIVTDMRGEWRRLEDKIDRRFDSVDRKLEKMHGVGVERENP